MDNARLCRRVGGAQHHLAATLRLEHAAAERQRVRRRHADRLLVQHHRGGEKLHVGRVETVAGAEKCAGLAAVRAQQSAAVRFPRGRIFRGRRREQALRVGVPAHHQERMILQARANRQIACGGDAMRRELRGGSDAGEHQDLRRIISTGRDNDFAVGANFLAHAVAHDLDTDARDRRRTECAWSAPRSALSDWAARSPDADKPPRCCTGDLCAWSSGSSRRRLGWHR